MKTTVYNPSELEVAFANALEKLKDQLEAELDSNKIVKVEKHPHYDNPMVRIFLVDDDDDEHEVVFKIIQVPDK